MTYTFKQTTVKELSHIIDGALLKKNIYNNYFGLELDGLKYIQTENTLVLRKHEEGFDRLYFMSDNKDELISILKEQPANTVFNIPSRKGHLIWDELANEAGYSLVDTFEHLINRNFEPAYIEGKEYATMDDFEWIKDKMLYYFNPITSHFPNDEELKNKVLNNEMLVIKEEGQVKAVMCYTISKGRCTLDFWYSESKQGLKLFYSMFDICHVLGIKTISHWVRSSNTKAKKIYLLLGDVQDGLIDKTYIKTA